MNIKDRKSGLNSCLKLFGYAASYAKEFIIWKTIWVVVKILKTIFVDIWLLKYIIDAVVGGTSFRKVALYIFICTVIAFAEMYLDDWIAKSVKPVAQSKIHKAVHKMIFIKIQNTDVKYFDNTEFYNDYIWSLERADEEIFSCGENVINLLQSILSIIFVLILLLGVNPLAILFSIVPMLFVAKIGPLLNKLEYCCEKDINPVSRKEKYSRRVFYLKQYVEDLKMSKIGNVMLENFEESVEDKIKLQKSYGRKKFALLAVQDGSYGFVQMLGLYLYLVYQAIVKKVISIGMCSAVISAVDRLNGYFYQFSSVLFAIQKNGIFAEKFFTFLNCQSEIEEISEISSEKLPAFEIIEFRNITFSYPHSPKTTLNGLNLMVRKGEKIALVGENGAGKTTLLKLILRLYDPENGEITYNGENIKKYNVGYYRSSFSTVFQNPQIYATKLVENVLMDKYQENEDTDVKVQECLEKAHIYFCKEDFRKNVTKEYDENGLEFSGGQRQKIAIARALYSNREIILMDEASAALDPISEKEINELLLEKLGDKTIFIITHRLTTVKNMDRILFMENGRIVEEGNHNELMKLHGKYYKLYNAQAESYRDTNKI